MAETKYVRITPYDKRRGALLQRYVVGGRLFEAGKWYTVPSDKAAKLAPMEQRRGVPVFQIVSEAKFKEVARREIAAAMVAAGLSGLAMQGAEEPTVVGMPKEGPRKSKFEGLENDTTEVDLGGPSPTDEPEADEDEDEDEDGGGDATPNIDRMRKADLLQLADEHGIEYPDGVTAAQLRSLLREHN